MLVGAAHAPSPDVRYGLPVLRSLDAACAPPGTDPPQADWSLAALAGDAGSRGTGSPSPTLVAQKRLRAQGSCVSRISPALLRTQRPQAAQRAIHPGRAAAKAAAAVAWRATAPRAAGHLGCPAAEQGPHGPGMAVRPRHRQPLKRLTMSEMFWPPNPKLLERARSHFPSRALLGT